MAAFAVLDSVEAPVRVQLLRGFHFSFDDERLQLPVSAQRVVAFLALQGRSLQRSYVAGTLWSDTSETRAAASLRSALWRLGAFGVEIIDAGSRHLRLAEGVEVDVLELVATARDLEQRASGDISGLISSFSQEILPDWYEEWLLEWREHWRQIRLHALDTLSRILLQRGRLDQAIEAALASVHAEPLRESAHRQLIQAHLAEGNQDEAVRQYQWYRRLLRDELGLDPSPQMNQLMRALATH